MKIGRINFSNKLPKKNREKDLKKLLIHLKICTNDYVNSFHYFFLLFLLVLYIFLFFPFYYTELVIYKDYQFSLSAEIIRVLNGILIMVFAFIATSFISNIKRYYNWREGIRIYFKSVLFDYVKFFTFPLAVLFFIFAFFKISKIPFDFFHLLLFLLFPTIGLHIGKIFVEYYKIRPNEYIKESDKILKNKKNSFILKKVKIYHLLKSAYKKQIHINKNIFGQHTNSIMNTDAFLKLIEYVTVLDSDDKVELDWMELKLEKLGKIHNLKNSRKWINEMLDIEKHTRNLNIDTGKLQKKFFFEGIKGNLFKIAFIISFSISVYNYLILPFINLI